MATDPEAPAPRAAYVQLAGGRGWVRVEDICFACSPAPGRRGGHNHPRSPKRRRDSSRPDRWARGWHDLVAELAREVSRSPEAKRPLGPDDSPLPRGVGGGPGRPRRRRRKSGAGGAPARCRRGAGARAHRARGPADLLIQCRAPVLGGRKAREETLARSSDCHRRAVLDSRRRAARRRHPARFVEVTRGRPSRLRAGAPPLSPPPWRGSRPGRRRRPGAAEAPTKLVTTGLSPFLIRWAWSPASSSRAGRSRWC